MSRLRLFLPLLAALGALASAGPAGAVQWNPQGTNTGPFSGTKTITTSTGATITCVLSGYIRATGNVAPTTNSTGTTAPPVWSSCSNLIAPGQPTTVTSSSAWSFTAASTTSVTESGVNFVARIGSICTVSASGVTIVGNAWSNSGHTLTENTSSSFRITESGLCDGGTTATLGGTLRFPATVTIS